MPMKTDGHSIDFMNISRFARIMTPRSDQLRLAGHKSSSEKRTWGIHPVDEKGCEALSSHENTRKSPRNHQNQ